MHGSPKRRDMLFDFYLILHVMLIHKKETTLKPPRSKDLKTYHSHHLYIFHSYRFHFVMQLIKKIQFPVSTLILSLKCLLETITEARVNSFSHIYASILL